jgi:hypothetical protein
MTVTDLLTQLAAALTGALAGATFWLALSELKHRRWWSRRRREATAIDAEWESKRENPF